MITAITYLMTDIFLFLFLCYVIILGAICYSADSYQRLSFFSYLVVCSIGIFFAILLISQTLFFEFEVTIYQLKYSYEIQWSKLCFLLFSLLFIILSKIYWRFMVTRPFEFAILILIFIIASSMLLSVIDSLILYLALELQSLTLYCLAAIRVDLLSSTRAGLKYFILGSFASGLLIYGLVALYHETGTTNFYDTYNSLFCLSFTHDMQSTSIFLSLLIIIVGFLFKLAIVPFHLWAPDIYSDSPIISTLLFSTLAKVVVGFLFLRLYFEFLLSVPIFWHVMLIFLFAISSFVGAVSALFEIELIRLLASSGIYNFSFLLLGSLTDTYEGIFASALYILIYVCQNFVLFILIMSIKKYATFEYINIIDEFCNVLSRLPYLYIILHVIYALASFSPLLNVIAKINLLWSSLNAITIFFLPVVNLVSSVIISFAYIRIVRNSYFINNAKALLILDKNFYTYFLLCIMLIFLLIIIVLINLIGFAL